MQLVLLFSLMLVVSMSAFSYRMLQEVVGNISSTQKMQASVLANNLSATGANFLLGRDYTAIEQMLLRAIEFPNVRAIQICDARGKLIGDVSRSAEGEADVHYGGAPLHVPAKASAFMEFSKDEMVVWQPVVLGDLLGWTKITYSLQAVVDAEKRFWLTNAFAGVAIILVALAVLRLLMRRPLTSIERYTAFAGKLVQTHGDKIPVDPHSIELQTLGDALNSASSRLAEQAAEVSNAMGKLEGLAAFPEGSPDIVLSMDAEANVTYMNPHGRQMLADLELSPDDIGLLLPPDYHAIVARCLSDGTTARAIEIESNQHTLLWTFAPLMSQRIVHCYAHEITEKRQAEEYSRYALMEKQAAEAANQAKSIFLANMSHEIRTPLNGVMGFLKLLSDTHLTPTQRDYLHTIEVSAKVLLTVINDILDVSKIEAGKISIEQIEIEFRELLEEVISLHTANAEDKGLDLILVFSQAVPTRVLGDPARISQVLSNLLGNGIKFTQHGEILVEVELIEETDADVLVEVSVKDSGIGISNEALERLFQPFSQADASTTRKYGGTGLGLVIAKRLVELMGGEMTVESHPGQGARFAFTLRLLKQEIASACVPLQQIMATLRMLTVTPNAGVARSLSENLASWGIASDTVGSGKAALTMLEKIDDRKAGYAAIILDDAVKDMTSKELAHRVKTFAPLSDIPMILIGGLSTCQNAQDVRANGFVCCIRKPAKSSDLYNELSKIFLCSQRTVVDIEPQALRLQSKETGGNLRVLIVDDNEINRKLAKILVEQLGGETDTAENGAQAVDACARSAYDLILMDANMPVMDGIEATLRIREAEQGKRHTLIIALTANALSGDRERYLAAGMDDYLSKPINEKAFVNTLKKLGLTIDRPVNSASPVAASEGETISHADDRQSKPEDSPLLPILDPKMGVELSFGERETWRTVLGMLFDSLPEYSASLIAAREDPEGLRQAAHKLAGASSYCGTPAITQAAKQVERLAKTGVGESTADALDELLRQIERLSALKQDGKLPEGEDQIY